MLKTRRAPDFADTGNYIVYEESRPNETVALIYRDPTTGFWQEVRPFDEPHYRMSIGDNRQEALDTLERRFVAERNPDFRAVRLEKTEKNAFAVDPDGGRHNLRDLDDTPEGISAGMVLPAQWGFMQNWPGQEVRYLWLFDSAKGVAQLKGKDPDYPFFDPRTIGYGGRAAIDSVFSKPGSKGLVAAIRYLLDYAEDEEGVRGPLPGTLFIDFMSVRKGWRRRGVNSLMIRALENEYPEHETLFSTPSHMGEAFIKARDKK